MCVCFRVDGVYLYLGRSEGELLRVIGDRWWRRHCSKTFPQRGTYGFWFISWANCDCVCTRIVHNCIVYNDSSRCRSRGLGVGCKISEGFFAVYLLLLPCILYYIYYAPEGAVGPRWTRGRRAPPVILGAICHRDLFRPVRRSCEPR